MATYAIGDIQGCYEALRRLLDKLQFDPARDTLWVTGDMVNRGPDSLSTLRFLKKLEDRCITILGNHDLHLLGVAYGLRKLKKKDTLSDIMEASDADELLHWLRHRPLLHHDAERQVTMVHAGIPPIWTIEQAIHEARQLEQLLQSTDYRKWLKRLFKEPPARTWDETFSQKKKIRLTAAYLTRMRFCDHNGILDFENKGAHSQNGFAPWFSFAGSPCYRETIVFGHWAALEGKTGIKNIHAIDTGCVWGKTLTALNLDTFERTESR